MSTLIRNVKLRSFFFNDTKPFLKQDNPIKAPSTFEPPLSKLSTSTLNLIADLKQTTAETLACFKQDPASRLITNSPLNLSLPEYKALHNLSKNQTIIIKPADKGGAVVVLDRVDYIMEAERQLSDPVFYKPISEPLIITNIDKITQVLKKLLADKFLTKSQYDFLLPGQACGSRHFYLLPKIHKEKGSWTVPGRVPPGRPIVSDCSTESSNICKYIESYLTPISNKHTSYIKDTGDFISKIRGKNIPQDAILFTADVASLYTNMDLNRTMAVVRQQLSRNPVQGRPDEYLLELLNIIIKNNDFEFNGQLYLQQKGVSMGRSFCPALANLYLLDFDHQAINNFKIRPIFYFRYLDDVWGVFPGTINDLQEYEQWLCTRTPGIKVTFQHHMQYVDFLDTTVYKFHYLDTCELQTKVFFKPTASHQLLHTDSFHPPHTTRGVLKSQILRYKRISSNYTDFKHTCDKVFSVLETRGYKRKKMVQIRNLIWKQAVKSRALTDAQTLQIMPLITTYNQVGVKLAHNWFNILHKTNLATKNKFIRAYKNTRNIKSYLVRSQLKPLPSTSSTLEPTTNTQQHNFIQVQPIKDTRPGFKPCKTLRCGACKIHASPSPLIHSTSLNLDFHINHHLTCASTNIIYVITCTKCNLQYVGETTRTLRERLTDHKSNIKTNKLTPVSVHFCQPLHSISDLKIVAIEKIPDQSNSLLTRLDRETYWIRKLATSHPRGLNNMPLLDFL